MTHRYIIGNLHADIEEKDFCEFPKSKLIIFLYENIYEYVLMKSN